MYAEPSDFDTIIRKGTGFTGTVDDMYAEYPDLALVVAKVGWWTGVPPHGSRWVQDTLMLFVSSASVLQLPPLHRL